MTGGYLIDADERLLGFSYLADTTRRNSCGLQFDDQFLAIVFGHGDEKATRGLRVKE